MSSCFCACASIVEDVAHQDLDRIVALRGVPENPELQRIGHPIPSAGKGCWATTLPSRSNSAC